MTRPADMTEPKRRPMPAPSTIRPMRSSDVNDVVNLSLDRFWNAETAQGGADEDAIADLMRLDTATLESQGVVALVARNAVGGLDGYFLGVPLPDSAISGRLGMSATTALIEEVAADVVGQGLAAELIRSGVKLFFDSGYVQIHAQFKAGLVPYYSKSGMNVLPEGHGWVWADEPSLDAPGDSGIGMHFPDDASFPRMGRVQNPSADVHGTIFPVGVTVEITYQNAIDSLAHHYRNRLRDGQPTYPEVQRFLERHRSNSSGCED
jgi:hypothetical protein